MAGPSIVREATPCVCAVVANSAIQLKSLVEAKLYHDLHFRSLQFLEMGELGHLTGFTLRKYLHQKQRNVSLTLETKGVASSILFSEVSTGKSTSQC